MAPKVLGRLLCVRFSKAVESSQATVMGPHIYYMFMYIVTRVVYNDDTGIIMSDICSDESVQCQFLKGDASSVFGLTHFPCFYALPISWVLYYWTWPIQNHDIKQPKNKIK